MEAAARRSERQADACSEEATGGSHRSAAAAGACKTAKAYSPSSGQNKNHITTSAVSPDGQAAHQSSLEPFNSRSLAFLEVLLKFPDLWPIYMGCFFDPLLHLFFLARLQTMLYRLVDEFVHLSLDNPLLCELGHAVR